MFVKSTRFKQVCQLLLSLIVGATMCLAYSRPKNLNQTLFAAQPLLGCTPRHTPLTVFTLKTSRHKSIQNSAIEKHIKIYSTTKTLK